MCFFRMAPEQVHTYYLWLQSMYILITYGSRAGTYLLLMAPEHVHTYYLWLQSRYILISYGSRAGTYLLLMAPEQVHTYFLWLQSGYILITYGSRAGTYLLLMAPEHVHFMYVSSGTLRVSSLLGSSNLILGSTTSTSVMDVSVRYILIPSN